MKKQDIKVNVSTSDKENNFSSIHVLKNKIYYVKVVATEKKRISEFLFLQQKICTTVYLKITLFNVKLKIMYSSLIIAKIFC